MGLILVPHQLAQQSDLYHQMGQMLSAGIELPRAIELLSRESGPFRQPLRRITKCLDEGSTFAQATQSIPDLLPQFDLALLEAGERSGRLDECLKILARYYQDRAKLFRKIISQMVYPVFLMHFAVLLSPLPGLFAGKSILSYIQQVALTLAPFYIFVTVLILISQSRRGEGFRTVLERILKSIPVLGSARQSLALARLAAALEALLNAGVGVIESWEHAANCSGSPALKKTVHQWRPGLAGGETPGDLLKISPYFPEMFANLYATGEVSGQLDQTLNRIYNYYSEEADRKMQILAHWVPMFFYLMIAAFVAIKVVSFWSNYSSTIDAVIQGNEN